MELDLGRIVGQQAAERGNEALHRKPDEFLIFALMALKPGPVVVSFEPPEEYQPFLRKAGERRKKIFFNRVDHARPGVVRDGAR
jgi:hypothetical protein